MKTLLLAFLLTSSLAAFGQGQVYFANRVTSPNGSVFAPIYGRNPHAPFVRISGNANTNGGNVNYTDCPLLSGPDWTASLWMGTAGATDLSSFQQVAVTTFSTAPSLGGIFRFQNPIVPIPPGTPASFQVRVWYNNGGAVQTWADVFRFGAVAGFSDVFNINVGGGTLLPANLVGLTSFNVTGGGIIPEPTTLVLALLIAGGFLSRRLVS